MKEFLIRDQGANLERVERPHHTTHDVPLEAGYQLKLTRDRLIGKIKRDEMN